MDSDRELLEWAAKAAGLTIARWVDGEKMTAGKPSGKKYMWLDESMSNVELVCRSITMAAAEIWKAMK